MKLSLDTLRRASTHTPGVGEVYPAIEPTQGVAYWLVVAYDKGDDIAHCLGFDESGQVAQVTTLRDFQLEGRPVLGTVDLSVIALKPTDAVEPAGLGKAPVLDLVDLRIPAYTGYMSPVELGELSPGESVCYGKLANCGLLEVCTSATGTDLEITDRGLKHLAAIGALELPC